MKERELLPTFPEIKRLWDKVSIIICQKLDCINEMNKFFKRYKPSKWTKETDNLNKPISNILN